MSLMRTPSRPAFPAIALTAVLLLTVPLDAQAAAPATAPSAGSDTTTPPIALDLESRIEQAVDHYVAGDFAAAAALLGEVVDSDGVTGRLRALAAFNHGAALLQLDRNREAIAAFDMADGGEFPYPAQLHLARGMAWERLGHPEKAAEDYSSALVADPSDPAVLRRVDAFFFKK